MATLFLSPSPSWGGWTAKRDGWGPRGASAVPRTQQSPARPALRAAHPPHKGEGK